MSSLQVTLDPFGAEFPTVEREIHPWLESHHLLVFHEELQAALLPAKAAVCLYDPIRRGLGKVNRRDLAGKMRAEAGLNISELCR